MSSFEEKLAARKKAERPSQVVSVSLDADLAEERAALQAQLDAVRSGPKDDRLGLKAKSDEIRERIDALQDAELDSLVELRVTRAPGVEWASLTASYPARLDSLVDRRYGFNLHALTVAEGWRWVERREGDAWVAFKKTDKPRVDQWGDFCQVISGGDLATIVDAVFELNVWEPQQRRERLGKLLQDRLPKQSG